MIIGICIAVLIGPVEFAVICWLAKRRGTG